jgi:copper resistance protein C
MNNRARLAGLAAVAATVLAVVATAVPAFAHAELVSSDPGQGATVRALPSTVTLTFSETVRTPAFVEVTGPGGTDVAAGDLRIVDADVTQRLGEPVGAGRYTLSYRITSADGHPVTGTVPFTVTSDAGAGGQGAQPTVPAPQVPVAPEQESGGIGTGQLVLLLGALAAGLAALGVGTRRALRHSVRMVEDQKSGRSRHT